MHVSTDSLTPRSPVSSHPVPVASAHRTYDAPHEVIADAALDAAAKREILCAWASDASAVDSQPTMRRLAGAAKAVPVADILSALRSLDH
jgi:hypothetical protein